MKKRSRACEECHRLKIKCDLSTPPAGAACERCTRNNLECVPSAPRLQRNRINELEAQVKELKNALREQSSSSNTPSLSPGTIRDDHDQSVLSFIDARISPKKQQHLLRLFAHQAGAAWPVIRLPRELDHLRVKSPTLLLSVLAYTVTIEAQGTELDVHDELIRETMRILGEEVIARGQRSLELVQALLVAAFWNKGTRGSDQGSCYQLVQLAADMAIDIGIAGYSLQPSPVAYFDRHQDTTSPEARRTWLACYVASASSSSSVRRPSTIPRNDYHEECLSFLELRGELPDLLLCQIVRISQLILETSSKLCLDHLSTFVDGNDDSTHATIESSKNAVDVWAAQIPPTLASSQTLKVWYHVAMIRIYEVILHTSTNKASFTSPFLPGRIPVKDFPKPTTLISPLRTALEALVHHCHGVIDTVTDMDPGLVVHVSAFSFTPNVIYSLFVLVTAMVAATGPENTYGQCLAKDNFRIHECGSKLRALATNMKVLDPTVSCYTTRMIHAMGWLEDWYNDYTAIVQRYEANLKK